MDRLTLGSESKNQGNEVLDGLGISLVNSTKLLLFRRRRSKLTWLDVVAKI